MPRSRWLLLGAFVLVWACSSPLGCSPANNPGEESTQLDSGGTPDVVSDTNTTPPLKLRVMTFNIGTTSGLPHDRDTQDGYTSKEAKVADELYENSLSWNPAEKALTAFLAKTKVDLVGFQEGYHDPWCETITVDPALDFVCKTYSKTRPLQVERLLGPEFQVACAEGQEDNCLGIRKSVGRFKDCPLDKPCLGGIKGKGPPNQCSRGARIGSIEVELYDGTAMTVVLVHGTSGFKPKDQDCRKAQFQQIFEDKGDGKPAASGAINLVLGDINTDPFSAVEADISAAYWVKFVGEGKPFRYISSSDPDGPKTYGGLVRIDHVVSDKLTGSCVVPGVSPDEPDVMDIVYWDHKPVICDVAVPRP
ncbi:MAG: hypothetical protein EP343_15515 [Deltaproteobacteria bacterium]|nr:MAG: hypothetical protein EP343_15515 [Deltaproteobacteria bacterium]